MKKFFPMRLLVPTASFLLFTASCVGQKRSIDAVINPREVERIERTLAADEMEGRRIFTPGIEKAADFIAAEFKAAGLQTWNNGGTYRQEFAMVRPKFISASATIDGVTIDQKNIIVITCQPQLKIDKQAGYELVYIKAGTNLRRDAAALAVSNKNLLVMVDESYAADFPRLSALKRSIFKTDKNIIFILNSTTPKNFTVESSHEITEQKLANVVGVLPGKGKKDEYVIFSGHYDHLGIGKPVNGDSIFNGANDDAAGITGVIMLATYFKEVKDNERTIVFAAFTAEESGGFGSQYFSRQLDASKVMAMFNIEMIGTESKWGKNSAYITGYEKSNMGEILAKDLKGTGFTFYPDPYPSQQLFYRSDNATLARLGVPAHTISTSKMDSEPNYHKLTDHIETLDMENMTMIIKAIALSSKSIVAGKETPTRVKVEELR